jgi:signal transduction histidine kinase
MPLLELNGRHASLRLLYAGTALLILVLLAMNVAVILHLRESELLDQENQLRNLSLTLAEQADRSFQSVDLVLSSVAERIAAEGVTDTASFRRKMTGEDIHVLLAEKISGTPQIDALTLIDRDGSLANFSRKWPPPDNDVSDREYFQAMKADPSLKTFLSAPARNRATGTWTIFMARRISGPTGGFIGLILGAIEMRYFEDFYRAISLGEGTTVAVQRMDGVLLARFPPTDAIGLTFANSEHLLRGGISGTVREMSGFDGQMRIKSAHHLVNYQIIALATKTQDAALANWRGIARLMSLGALGCAISIAAAAVAFARQWRQQSMLAQAQSELRRQADRTAAFEAMKTAKEAAEMADRAKSEFLATMSHELRTPLNAVLGFSEMMVGEVFGPLGNDRYRGYAQDIHTSGSHLLNIIDDVLDLSKAAAGKLELIEDWINVRTVVQAVCRLVQPRIDAAALSLTVRMPTDDLIAFADERLLKQMLLNLLSNACKFTPAGGRIECVVSVDDAGLTLAVADTGVGIPPEHLDRVLQPFVQVDSSLSRRHEGTGLGLALVKVMAELHGGLVRLDSKLGCGTTVCVILPLSRLNRAKTASAANTAAALTSAALSIA